MFLGFRCSHSEIDIAPATVKKIKAKMHRKSRALLRWRKRNDIEGEKAASAFIRIFNKKLLDDPMDNELTWSCWFFSLINTDKSLKIIDQYAQDRIRYIISGTNKKSRFNVRYKDMKNLGYKSLVNAYYDIKPQKLKNAPFFYKKKTGQNIICYLLSRGSCHGVKASPMQAVPILYRAFRNCSMGLLKVLLWEGIYPILLYILAALVL